MVAWLLPELKAKADAAPREATMTERLNFIFLIGVVIDNKQ